MTRQGILVPGIKRHYIRINPADPSLIRVPNEDPDHGMVADSQPPAGVPYQFPAREIVDGGFLELVRYGIRKRRRPADRGFAARDRRGAQDRFPGRAVLAALHSRRLRPARRRRRFHQLGRGRPWPLLTGERGHYELAAGRDCRPYIRAMEGFATPTRLLPEQIWDQPDMPRALMLLRQANRRRDAADVGACGVHQASALGRRRRSLRSHPRGRRALSRRQGARANRDLETQPANRVHHAPLQLRIQAPEPFMLHWSKDEWHHVHDSRSTAYRGRLRFRRYRRRHRPTARRALHLSLG